MKDRKNKHLLQFFSHNGTRAVNFSDVIVLLLERGHKSLAEEFDRRGEQAFTEIYKEQNKKHSSTWTATPVTPPKKKHWWQK